MKNGRFLFLLTLITAILLPSLSQAFVFPGNEPEGFRGIKWGTNIAKLPDMVILKGAVMSEPLKIYKRTNDKMSIGEARIDGIYYYSFEGRFFSVLITFTGLENLSLVKQTIEQLYGVSFRDDDADPTSPSEVQLWDGRNVAIYLSYNTQEQGQGVLRFDFKPIKKEKAAYDKKREKEKAKKTAKDLGL